MPVQAGGATTPAGDDGGRKRRSGSSRDAGGDGGDDEDDHEDDQPRKMSRTEEIETTDPAELWWVRIVVRTSGLDMTIEEMNEVQFVNDHRVDYFRDHRGRRSSVLVVGVCAPSRPV